MKQIHEIDKAKYKQKVLTIVAFILMFHDITDKATLAEMATFIVIKVISLGLLWYVLKLNKISRWLRP